MRACHCSRRWLEVETACPVAQKHLRVLVDDAGIQERLWPPFSRIALPLPDLAFREVVDVWRHVQAIGVSDSILQKSEGGGSDVTAIWSVLQRHDQSQGDKIREQILT